MKTVLALRNVAYEDLDGFEGAFEEAGYKAVYRDALSDEEPIASAAMEHGEGCRASVRCLAPRKPPGFSKATEDLDFNLVEKSLGSASAT